MNWKKTNSLEYADCRVYKIRKERWENPARSLEGDFFIMDVRDWVVVLAKTVDDTFVMVEQFRFGSEEKSLEFPAGLIEEGEDIIAAAERELYEESGYTGESSSIIASVHPNPAIQRNLCHYVLVEGARKTGPGAPDLHEEFSVTTHTLENIKGLIDSGKISHAIVHAAILNLERMKKK